MMIIDISTDGSVLSNPGPGGWAAVIRCNGYAKVIFGYDDSTTNNRMELMGPIKALEYVKKPAQIRLYCDSQYVVNGVTKWNFDGTKVVLNQDLWQRLNKAKAKHKVEWIWVRGHDTHGDNNNADCFSREAAKLKDEGVTVLSRMNLVDTNIFFASNIE